MKTYQVQHEPGDTLKSAYFCNAGLVSILSVFADGKSVEVGLVGKEGFVGVPLVAGLRRAPTRAIAQIEGTAGILQKAGFITHTRGDVEIINRKKLEEAACECYAIMQRRIREWQSDSQ